MKKTLSGLKTVALTDIEKSLGIKGEPQTVQVTNWKDLMPNYHVKHSQAVHSLNQKMSSMFPNVILAGSSYFGVGIGTCINNGKETAISIGDKVLHGN